MVENKGVCPWGGYERVVRLEEEQIGHAMRDAEQEYDSWEQGIKRAMQGSLDLFLLNHPELKLAAPVRFEPSCDGEPSFELSTLLARTNGKPLHAYDLELYEDELNELAPQWDELNGLNTQVELGANTGAQDLDTDDLQLYLRADISFLAYV